MSRRLRIKSKSSLKKLQTSKDSDSGLGNFRKASQIQGDSPLRGRD